MKLGVIVDRIAFAVVTIAVALPMVGGCLGCRSLGASAPKGTPAAQRRCAGLDSQHRAWGGVAAGSAVLAGSGGLGGVVVKDDAARLSLAISAALIGAIGAGAAYVSNSAAGQWGDEGCGR